MNTSGSLPSIIAIIMVMVGLCFAVFMIAGLLGVY